jgi:hypothetical protein
VEQRVVQRRRTVAAQRVPEIAQREARDVDRERLVEPEVGARPEEQDEPRDEDRTDVDELSGGASESTVMEPEGNTGRSSRLDARTVR